MLGTRSESGVNSPRQVRRALLAVRQRIERGWCQGHFATDASGRALCDFADPRAAAWCLLGAIWAESPDNFIRSSPAYDAFMETHRYIKDINTWNDAPGRTKAHVLAALDLAIEARSAVSR